MSPENELSENHELPICRNLEVIGDDSVFNIPESEEYDWTRKNLNTFLYPILVASKEKSVKPDIRMSRAVLIKSLMEAYNPILFLNNKSLNDSSLPTEADRQATIKILEFLISKMGFLSVDTIYGLRDNWIYQNIYEHKLMLYDLIRYPKVNPSDHSLEKVSDSLNLYKEIYPKNKTALWTGTWNPLHFMQLLKAGERFELCHKLVIGVDCDELVLNTKGHLWRDDRTVYPLNERISAWKSTIFPSFIVTLDFHEARDEEYLRYFQTLQPDIVFLSSNTPHYQKRKEQILSIGAIPYSITTLPIQDFSSTNWWEFYSRH